MGNQMSVPQRTEDQENESETDTYKVASERECGQNGMPVIVSTRTVQLYDEVDLGISIKEDNAATSSRKTMEISAVADANGKNLGKEAKAEAPAAKSRFFLTLSRPVPGRTGDQATDSSAGPGKLDVSSSKAPGNKEPSESRGLPAAAAQGPGPDKSPGPAQAADQAFRATWEAAPLAPESGGAAPSKPKDSGFFDKLFKLDKGREEAPGDSHQEARSAEHPDLAHKVPGLSRQPQDVPAERDIVDSKEQEGQEITTVTCSASGDPEELEIAKEDPQTRSTTDNNTSIMSFFKTLVSPNKAEPKKDLEDTGAEKSPTTSADIKSDKANFIPQETQEAAKKPTPTETAKEGAKEKGGPTSLPLGKLFWKKTADSAEKAITPPEAAPAGAGPKGKESSSRDKKAAAEASKQKGTKQEAQGPAPSAEPLNVEVNSLPNGEKSQRRPEKRRQSLGGFFKGLGPKRMLDAQVQTDPVSIGPVGKPK
ncbi:breast carcinoma-amplified sequence 1 isoform X8 [Manis pentadactyla]|uniref:breast carcinoma-amplified sequence 1 isoform X8 n=1 Tax=Manis pentadactyla TaxID=143292 RepID=UPI00255C797E|nr:breast carcinoma-amplified sequence 1 isoform X8 [Manis pentadactyla]